MRSPFPMRLLAGATIAVLTGCGGGGASPATSVSADPASAVATPTAVDVAANDGVVVDARAGGRGLLATGYSRLYGPGVETIDTLSNFTVNSAGGALALASQRFRAPVSGRLASLKTYWPDGKGYAAGSGGAIRIRVVPDDATPAHFPNLVAVPVASGLYQPAMQGGKHAQSTWHDTIALEANSGLVAGNLYHVVYDNVDPAPASNWASVNFVATLDTNGHPNRWLDPIDWGALQGSARSGTPQAISWKDLSVNREGFYFHAPLLQLNLADGGVFGTVEIESGNDPDSEWIVAGDVRVRERFTPSVNRRFQGLSFATASSAAGALRWEILDGDLVLASGTVDETQPSFRVENGYGVVRWFDVALPAPLEMAANRPYDIVFTAQDTGEWHFLNQRNGSDYGFAWPAAFTESQAQHWIGGRWIDAYHLDHSESSRGSNWRVVLHLTP